MKREPPNAAVTGRPRLRALPGGEGGEPPPAASQAHAALDAVWKSARENLSRPVFYPLEGEVAAEYHGSRAAAFGERLGISTPLIIASFLLYEAAALLSPVGIPPLPALPFVVCLVAELALLTAARRVRSLRNMQALAVMTLLVPLALIVRYLVVDPAYFLMIIFVTGFFYPWDGVETALVTLLPVAGYLLVQRRLHMTPDAFGAGFVFLFSLFIVTSFQLHRERDRRKGFVLRREAEAAQLRLVESLELAARLHKGILTDNFDLPILSARILYQPMQQLGGDYVKVEPIADHRVAMLIADVTGHGAPAALMINRINARVENLMASRHFPADAAYELNRFVTQTFFGTSMLMSALWAEYDARSSVVRWANYGHPPPILFNRAAGTASLLSGSTLLMGIDETRRAREGRQPVSPGDLLLFFTDGLIELDTVYDTFDLRALVRFLRRNFTPVPNGAGAEDLVALIDRMVRGRRMSEPRDDLLAVVWEIKATVQTP